MYLAGVQIKDELLLTLASKLNDAGLYETAVRLENAYDLDVKIVALSMRARDDILQVLTDCPKGLRELRAALRQHKREGRMPVS
jgi:hypothetical protein